MSNTYEPKFAINVNAKYIGMDKFKNHTFGLDESTYISLKNLFTKDQESDFKTPLSSYEYSGKTYFNLKVKERPAISLGIKADHAGRWLSLSAPFPVPDREIMGANGQPILYPTIEHYMAAMKYIHASNLSESKRNYLAISLFSTTGSIHQKYAMERLQKKVTPGSGTPVDDALLEKEAADAGKDRVTEKLSLSGWWHRWRRYHRDLLCSYCTY